MSSENSFWLSCWGIVGTTLVLIVALSTNYWIDHNAKVVGLIESGVDPVAVMCAMQDDYGVHPTCLVLAAKR